MKTIDARLLMIMTLSSALVHIQAQQVDSTVAEEHPPLPILNCVKGDGCSPQDTTVVLDADLRKLHQVDAPDVLCLDHGKWNAEVCPDAKRCAENCAYDGYSIADYDKTFGVTTAGDELTLQYAGTPSPRVYMMANETQYKMFHLLNQEFAFDIDSSALECGMNGAVYFVSMDQDAGMAAFPTNRAGAKFGTGYCDVACSTPGFVNGHANFTTPTSLEKRGLCCMEMDLWEANKISTVLTSHSISKTGTYECQSEDECYVSNVFNDKPGCGINPYASGNHLYYGPGSQFKVDTTNKLTVITQFITDNQTAQGNLVEIRRLYKQNGVVIANVETSSGKDSITDAYCGEGTHKAHGGLTAVGRELRRGVVLAMSVWADSVYHMTWLDSGIAGSCQGNEDTAVLAKMGISLKLSNLRVGDIGTTYGSEPTKTTSPPPATVAPSTASPGNAATTAPAASATGATLSPNVRAVSSSSPAVVNVKSWLHLNWVVVGVAAAMTWFGVPERV